MFILLKSVHAKHQIYNNNYNNVLIIIFLIHNFPLIIILNNCIPFIQYFNEDYFYIFGKIFIERFNFSLKNDENIEFLKIIEKFYYFCRTIKC